MKALLDLVAPAYCLGCGRTTETELCPICADRVRAVRRPFCERCGEPTAITCSCGDLEGFVRARSLVVFAEPARRLTLTLKRHGGRALARSIGSLLAELVRAEGMPCDVVAFVPAGKRADRRGFDPGYLLATSVARSLDRPARKILRRVADGPRQADVPLARRRANVRGRFEARGAQGSVLLVDDVYTTGATAEACSLALRHGGAAEVNVVTWARTLRRLTRENSWTG